MSGIINLSVGIESAATPRTSFGIPLILDHSNFKASVAGNPDIRTYSTLSEMRDDGWKSYHAAYKMAAALLAQQPRVATFKVAGVVGTIATSLDDIVTEDPDWYALLSTSRVQADIEDIADWVEAADSRCLFLACTNDSTAKGAGESVLSALFQATRARTMAIYQNATAQVARIYFDKLTVSGNRFNCKINGTSITEVHFDGAIITTHNGMIGAIATELAATAAISTATPGTTTGAPLGSGEYDYIEITAAAPLVEQLMTDAYFTGGAAPRPTARQVETTAASIPADAAWCGKVLPSDPGSATWAHKTLTGVLPDTLTTAQRGYIQTQRGNWYAKELGFSITFPGTCAAESSPGTPYFADQIQLADAIESELQTGLMEVLNKAKKVPYTDQGVAALLAVFQKVEDRYVSSGALVKKSFDDSYTVPTVANQAPSDVSNRIFRGIKASWQTSGGIHVVADMAVSLKA